MNITLLYFPDCPHWQLADERLSALAAEEPDVTISHAVVDTDDAANAVGFRGSPTFHFGGIDPFGDPSTPVGLSCRLYPTPDGYAGSPTLDQLRDAVRTARHA
ncbi:MAG: thioredoxin family protein [Ilumatobacteraceae bacterium]